MKLFKLFKFKNYAVGFLMVLMIASFFTPINPTLIGASASIAFVGGTIVSFMPKAHLFMAVTPEIWQNDIMEEIFKDNAFLRKSHNADQYIIGGAAVHIPQSGGSGNVEIDRAVIPATVRQRTDTDVIYLLKEATSDPVYIKHAETKELSYDKRDSVLREDKQKVKQKVAEQTLINWVASPVYGTYGATTLPAGNVILTTGESRTAMATAATGNRLGAALKDLQTMANKARRENYWFEGRMNAMLTPEMLTDLFPADSVITATYMQNVTEAERRAGIMYKVQGWNIMSRSSVYRVNAGGSILMPEAVGTTTDDEASLFWYDGAVEFAMGNVEFFEDKRNPTYYGDIYSFLARFGGRARRADYKGIYLLKEAKTA